MFSGEMDSANAFVDIQSGAGGTEAQDWAEMPHRMYLRWCEHRGWKTELMEGSGGYGAGDTTAPHPVTGRSAHGRVEAVVGGHRVVRSARRVCRARPPHP